MECGGCSAEAVSLGIGHDGRPEGIFVTTRVVPLRLVLTHCDNTTRNERGWSDVESGTSKSTKRQAHLKLHPLSTTQVNNQLTCPKELHAN